MVELFEVVGFSDKADRIVFMEDGETIEESEPAEFFGNTKTPAVKRVFKRNVLALLDGIY